MALIPASILFPQKYGIGENFSSKSGKLQPNYNVDAFLQGGISFDLIMEESHTWQNDVADHAVEDGSTLTDHIRNKPREGKLVGMISDYSLNSFAGENIGTNPLNSESIDVRSKRAYLALKELWKSRKLVDIVVVMETYKNVAITDVQITKNPDSSSHQLFEISFKEVNIRKLETITSEIKVNVGEMDSLIAKQAAESKEVGRQVADYKSASLGFSIIPPL